MLTEDEIAHALEPTNWGHNRDVAVAAIMHMQRSKPDTPHYASDVASAIGERVFSVYELVGTIGATLHVRVDCGRLVIRFSCAHFICTLARSADMGMAEYLDKYELSSAAEVDLERLLTLHQCGTFAQNFTPDEIINDTSRFGRYARWKDYLNTLATQHGIVLN